MIINEKLLFVCHMGQVSGRAAGIIMEGHTLPIACSHSSWAGKDGSLPVAESGIQACWESTTDVEAFFGEEGLNLGGGIKAPPPTAKPPPARTHPRRPRGFHGWRPSGLYVYEVEYDEGAIDDDSEWWEHLQGGTLRRPTVEELEPLTRSQAPWGGVVL